MKSRDILKINNLAISFKNRTFAFDFTILTSCGKVHALELNVIILCESHKNVINT